MQPKKGRTLNLILITVALALMILVGTILGRNTKLFSADRRAINRMVGDTAFNFYAWEASALAAKIEAALVSAPSYIAPENQKQLVLTYAEAVGDVRRLDRELERVFTTDENAEESSQELQALLAERRAEAARLQDSAEAILQQQVATILNEEAFNLANAIAPPVQARLTPLPLMLIVSPRDRIEQLYAFPLDHGLTTAEQEALEQQVFENEDLAALTVPIGGLGVYPAMIIETGNVNFLAEVIAHEWAHHWLSFHPLGFNYGAHPETRIINETVASILGNEIGPKVIERYYPELMRPPPVEFVKSDEAENEDEVVEEEVSAEPPTPPAFDYRATMRDTRVRADELLADGKIEEAEAYMESQRQLFVEEGYVLRKINQSYFAFYGAYADTPGATGGNPIGPTVIAVRNQTPSLKAFMDAVTDVQLLSDLEKVLLELGGELPEQ